METLSQEKADLMAQLAANETKHQQELAEASRIFERTMERSRAQVGPHAAQAARVH